MLFIIGLSLIISNIGSYLKKIIILGIIWFRSYISSIINLFFYKANQAPLYHLRIGLLLISNAIEFTLFFILYYIFILENKKKK